MQCSEVVWFGDEVGNAHLLEGADLFSVEMGGVNDHWNIFQIMNAGELTNRFHTIDAGHVEVEENDIGLLGLLAKLA